MMFYETSALEGTKVEEAFLQMAKAALKRESDKSVIMPPTLGNAEGALKLNAKEHKPRGETKSESNCGC
jgi:hypothetical protein